MLLGTPVLLWEVMAAVKQPFVVSFVKYVFSVFITSRKLKKKKDEL